MPKLTAAQIRSVETVLYHLNRANKYLLDDRVVLSIRRGFPTTTLDYVSPAGDALMPVDKQIGSDIAGLEMAIGYLQNFLTFNTKA